METELPRLRVLVVDDDEDILELIGEYLRIRGHSVQTRTDPTVAMDTLRERRLDVLICDVQLGGSDGFALVAEARQLDRPVAVLMMTAFGSVDIALRAMREGAGDLLLKPFRLRDLYVAMARALARADAEHTGARARELATFYELALSAQNRSQFPQLLRHLVALARRETGAAEAAVWLPRGPSWDLVVQTGPLTALTGFDPEPIIDIMQPTADIVAVPLWLNGRRVGVVAAGGGRRKAGPTHERLALLARAMDVALVLLGEGRADEERPST